MDLNSSNIPTKQSKVFGNLRRLSNSALTAGKNLRKSFLNRIKSTNNDTQDSNNMIRMRNRYSPSRVPNLIPSTTGKDSSSSRGYVPITTMDDHIRRISGEGSSPSQSRFLPNRPTIPSFSASLDFAGTSAFDLNDSDGIIQTGGSGFVKSSTLNSFAQNAHVTVELAIYC